MAPGHARGRHWPRPRHAFRPDPATPPPDLLISLFPTLLSQPETSSMWVSSAPGPTRMGGPQ